MAFDTASYLDAITPPTFTHQGRTWTGRILSVPQYLEFLRMADSLDKAADITSAQKVYERITDFLFPPPTRKVRRFWGVREERDLDQQSCWDVLATLPMAVQTEAIKDFTNSLAAALTPASSTALLREMTPEERNTILTTTPTSTSPATDDASASK